MSIPFVTLFMTNAMRQLPSELIDAAVIDGASPFRVLRYVVAPLLGPATSTTTLFLFIWTWNEFMIPLILVQDDARRTLPIGMLFFQGKYTVDVPVLTAGAVITLLPVVVVYFLFQREFIQGLTTGAVK
jgi:raffinose/stachyose/melibiose transport system permease protein